MGVAGPNEEESRESAPRAASSSPPTSVSWRSTGTRSISTRSGTCGATSRGFELVPNTGRLCVMNLYLHGIDAARVTSGQDSLAQDPGERYSVVLTHPPFGKKSSVPIDGEGGELEKEDISYEREGFWTTTKNKQLTSSSTSCSTSKRCWR